MIELLGCVCILSIGATPFLPLAARQMQRHGHRAVRRVGDTMAMIALWTVFNVSFLAMWGVWAVRLVPTVDDLRFVVLFLALQVPAAVSSHRVARSQRR